MNKIFVVAGIIILAYIIVLFIVLGGGQKQDQTPESEPTQGNTAPDFSLEDYNGNRVALGDFQGKPIIVNSWAVWCPFCVKELEDFAKLQQEFGDKIVIIAIDRAEPLSKVKQYTDDLGVTDNLVFLLDPKDSFYRSIGGFSMPETIFVDGKGNIILHKRGPMTIDEMKAKVQQFFAL